MRSETFVRRDSIMRKAGVAVVTGALLFSMSPLPALAEGASSSSGSGTATSQPAGEPPSGGGEAPGDAGGSMPGGGGGGGANTMTYDYTGVLSGTLTADGDSQEASDQTITATEADVNAALAENGGALALSGVTLEKSGDDTNGDNCNFYGVNSILLATGDSTTAKVSNSKLNATSEGSNAIFATDGATVYANGDTITTSAGNSRGLDATYGGTVIANEMGISTQGDHCASIATDRGGGNISVTNSTLSTAGSGSPLLYSTGDIEVSDVTGTTTGSQIAGMEGLNTILINNSSLSSTITDKTASDPVTNAVIIYQSTSGDAESTTGEAATFQAVGSTLSSAIQSGAFFYVTNTTANILLQGTTLDYDSSAANLIQVEGNDSNSWGTAGSNGGTATLALADENVKGNVSVDTISSLALYLTNSSTWTGAASITGNANGSTSDSPVTVNVDDGSTWVVTADSTVSALNVASSGSVVDESGKTVTIVANGQAVVQGTSDVTVTVTDSYTTTYDGSGASTASTDLIDRSAFDAEYGTNTTFVMGDSTATSTATDSSADAAASASGATSSSTGNVFLDIWNAIVDFFTGR
ncbi:MAG: hypothetical protein LKK41_02970 [Olsenella sp.]|nr:hypothetical protein [Olsenella sp.]